MGFKFKNGKDVETIKLYMNQRNALAKYLEKINDTKINDTHVNGASAKYLLPISSRDNRYLVYIHSQSMLTYYYFYSEVDRHLDFCIESDSRVEGLKGDIILRVCLFDSKGCDKDKKILMVQDILVKNSQVVKVSYNLRYLIVLDLVFDTLMHEKFHPKFKFRVSPQLEVGKTNLDVFFSNFKYKLGGLGLMNDDSFQQIYYMIEDVPKVKTFRIKKTEFTDVYNVYDLETDESNGLLYIKTLKDSKWLREQDQDVLEIDCIYNTRFDKWSPYLQLE